MKLLIPVENLVNLSSRELIPCECYRCKKTFYTPKNIVQRGLLGKRSVKYCSPKCHHDSTVTRVECSCLHCGKKIVKAPNVFKLSKNVFCSCSCAATYNNTHKTKGYRRSKLERWLEEQLSKAYPNLEIHYCRKDAINSELDIYIPSLKLAFELNGIFHYEPIYGGPKLEQIKNNDTRKFQACIEVGIELCIIDTSSLHYFKPEKAERFLHIICRVIDTKRAIGRA